jgi:hypothetical protein
LAPPEAGFIVAPVRRAAAIAVVLVLGTSAGSAHGAVPLEGSWKGETSAGLPVSFGVSGGRVVNTRFKFEWGFCGTFENHSPGASLEIDASGHWVFEDPRGQTFEATFAAPDRAEGNVISVERQTPGCPRTEATFTAAPVPPNPESLAAARAGIEALPYRIRLRQPPGVKNTLIGKVRGSLGETFRFFLFVNRDATARLRNVPGYSAHGPGNTLPGPGLTGGPLANTDVMFSSVPRRTDTKAQRRERRKILAAVEATICLRQTGAPCAKQ